MKERKGNVLKVREKTTKWRKCILMACSDGFVARTTGIMIINCLTRVYNTIAVLRNFNQPTQKLVWDMPNQGFFADSYYVLGLGLGYLVSPYSARIMAPTTE